MFPDFTFDKNVKLQNLAKNHKKSGKNHKISRKFPKFRIYLPGEFPVHFLVLKDLEFYKNPRFGLIKRLKWVGIDSDLHVKVRNIN